MGPLLLSWGPPPDTGHRPAVEAQLVDGGQGDHSLAQPHLQEEPQGRVSHHASIAYFWSCADELRWASPPFQPITAVLQEPGHPRFRSLPPGHLPPSRRSRASWALHQAQPPDLRLQLHEDHSPARGETTARSQARLRCRGSRTYRPPRPGPSPSDKPGLNFRFFHVSPSGRDQSH